MAITLHISNAKRRLSCSTTSIRNQIPQFTPLSYPRQTENAFVLRMWYWLNGGNLIMVHWTDPGIVHSPKWRLIGNLPQKKCKVTLVVTITGEGDNPRHLFFGPQKSIEKPSSDSTQFVSPCWLPHLSEVPMVESVSSPKQLATKKTRRCFS